MLNKHHSIETKRKIGLANSISLLGKVQSLETVRKRADKLIGNKNNFGKNGIMTGY